ncbi:MAG: hypothetical protein K2O10_00990 [Muribaculaceae bacterium]|nr:hypothetical protein [Muribaculaceae bacterium]
MKKLIVALLIGLATALAPGRLAADIIERLPVIGSMARSPKILLDSAKLFDPALKETVIVGGDTVPVILPQKNYGRYDRGLYNYLFIPTGQWSFGLMASYGEFNTDNYQILSVLTNLDLKVKAYSLQPSISYFIGNNQSIGLKFNYSKMYLDLPSMGLDVMADMSFTLSDISYYSNNYTTSVAYRNYVGLGRERRFGVFNEVDLSFGAGSSRFKRYYNGELRDTRTNAVSASLNFSPGVCVFIMDYVSFNVSFGVFGIKVHHEKQQTNGYPDGTRFTSGANFRFNIFNINFGMAVYI